MNALELAVVNYMPPEYIPALRKAISLKAEQERRLDDGRRQTSNRLRTLVLAAITDIRAKLEGDVYTNRRHAIEEHLKAKYWHYGLEHEQQLDGTVKVKLPNRKLIREVLTSQGL